MSRYKLTLFADYHQFYIQDENADGNLSDAWTGEAVERLLAIAPGTVGIGTVRNVDVPVTIAARAGPVTRCRQIRSSRRMFYLGGKRGNCRGRMHGLFP